MPPEPRFPDRHLAREDPTPAELAAMPAGTELEPEPDGQPRYVCSCHLVRHRVVLGRSVARVLWSGVLVPLVGIALIALDVLAVIRLEPLPGRLIAAALPVLLLAGCVAAARSGGHHGWCATRAAAYWFVAFPALLLGALTPF